MGKKKRYQQTGRQKIRHNATESNKLIITHQHYEEEELKLRKKFSEWMGISDPTKRTFAFFTPGEMIEKYAKEFAFWSAEAYMSSMLKNANDYAKKHLASRARIHVMKQIKHKFIDDDDMLEAIYHESQYYHKEYNGYEMDNMSKLLLGIKKSS